MSPKIYISPSDQDKNIYASGKTNEAQQCRKIAVAAVEALNRCGFTAKTDVTAEMEDRVDQSNSWGADVHLCIHTNAFNGQVQGTRLFSYDTSGTGYQICKAVMATLAPITPGESDNITAWPGLYEIRAAVAPTVYVEVGFHDNAQEAAWIISHTVEIAEALTKGLCNYYAMAYINPKQPAGDETVYNNLEEIPAFARATAAKLLDRDLLTGTSAGLELSEQMLRVLVITDRAGLYD